MGFILLSLVVGAFLLLACWIICKVKSKFAKILKVVICLISIGCLYGFVNKLFIGKDVFYNSIIVMIGVLCLVMAFANGEKLTKKFVSLSTCAIVILGVVLGLGAGSGYEDKLTEIESIELVECNIKYDEEECSFYVYEEEYNYIYLKLNSANNKFEEVKISKGKARIEENDGYIQPTLVTYEKNAKETFWSFGLSKKTEYVFYVPAGAISRDIFQ